MYNDGTEIMSAQVFCEHLGGRRMRFRSSSQNAVEVAAWAQINSLDPYQSPGIESGPFKRDGLWEVVVRWFPID